jgi:hypothetical protein
MDGFACAPHGTATPSMTARRYKLQNVEQEPPHSFGWETPDREAREDFRRGQVARLIFRDANGNGEMLSLITLESHDNAYVGEVLDTPSIAGVLAGDRVAFGPEHVAVVFEGDVAIGSQQLSHYQDEIVLGVDDGLPASLAHLRYFPYISRLSLRETDVEDLSLLCEAPNLRILDIDKTNVADLSPLRSLRDLHTLFASETRIEDLEPLRTMRELVALRLTSNPVSDLTPLAGLPDLEYLNVGITHITAMPLLEGLATLEALDVCATKISDLSWISRCTSLRKFNALATYFDSLAPLAHATDLRRVTLSVDASSDLSVLASLKKLSYVGILLDAPLEPTQARALAGLTSRGVDVVCSTDVDELVDALSPVMH